MPISLRPLFPAVTVSVLLLAALPATAADSPFDGVLQWHGIGPSRGGRVTAVSGVIGDDRTYYMGAAGGGVWKTTDAGHRWRPISDGFFETGSVGAVAVAPSEPDVVYVGMGERDPRGNFSHGDGVYGSRDAGETWSHLGLTETRQIGAIVVDPNDADRLFVAALGHIYGANDERGIFRSNDGGANWEHVHFVDANTGAVDLAMHPEDPDTLIAAYWQINRTPHGMSSGGAGSGMYRTTDGGDTWTALTEGLPETTLGKIGVTYSPANPDLVWAMVEAEEGGLFRSLNGGDDWTRVNEDRMLRQRAWYYTHVYADPVDVDTVYVLNVGLMRSRDGGASFQWRPAPHSDHHDLWINPNNPKTMINGNDGGANVSFDGGQSWSRQDNQPTAQFYHVTVDNRFPYRVYGAQQDNSTASISSRSREYSVRGLYAVGGGESGYIAVHPENPDIVYAGSYGGYLTRHDHATGLTTNITVWPENPMGDGVDSMKERFQWTFPILISPHDPEVVYVGGHRVHRTTTEGRSWETISPDLTTNDPELMGPSGGPITHDNTSVEYYCTIFALAESPLERGVLWAGSDDGLVHVSRDNGSTWSNVTPAMRSLSLISQIEASAHEPGRAFLAVNRYKHDDFAPMIYRTDDYGVSWLRIDSGIGDEAFVRVVREDPINPDVLYAGTELGVFVSFNGGGDWSSLQLDLPVVPITDLVVKDDDLVLATQGRSFQILSGLSLLRQWTEPARGADLHLFAPSMAEHAFRESITVTYRVGTTTDEPLRLEIIDASGEVIESFEEDTEPDGAEGLHTVRWNARYPDAVEVPDAIMWGGGTRGPRAAPGTYGVRLTRGETVLEQSAELRLDPRTGATLDDEQARLTLLLKIRDAVSQTHKAVNRLRAMRDQLDTAQAWLESFGQTREGTADVIALGETLRAELDAIEDAVIQHRSKSSQDPLNFPIRLNDKIAALSGVVAGAPGRPTAQSEAVYADLMKRLEPWLARLEIAEADQVPAYNAAVTALALPTIWMAEDEDGGNEKE